MAEPRFFSHYLLFVLMFQGCSQRPVYLAFDDHIPDTIPRIFAAQSIGRDGSYTGYCSFDRKEREMYYSITNRPWNTSQIVRLNPRNQMDTLSLGINRNWEGEPMFTPNGNRMYFTAIIPPARGFDWQADLFYIERTDDGWSMPIEFELNSRTSEWHISFSSSKAAYFGSERDGSRLKADIFYSRLENGRYKTAVKLPSIINTEYNDCDPLIAPDESYLIFHSDRPGGFGEHDLYVSFRKGENIWSEAVNLGGKINTSGWEMGPSLSPDGNYLFFTRRKSWDTDEPSKIFWVDISGIGSYRLK